jgi:SAM-dependent methyltransferase
MNIPGVNFCVDICNGITCEDSSVDYLISQDFLEHLPPEKKVFVINEIWRVLKPGGIMEHSVPNAGSQNDFGSPTHLSHWTLQQFDHWNVDSYRYTKDKEFEGITGGFKMLVRELVNPLKEEDGVTRFQSIHVKMEAIKE